jgi:hypothetical protein
METLASIIAAVQLFEQVANYVNGVSGAKSDRVRLCGQIRACCVILWQIRDQAEDFDEGKTWSQTIRVLATPLNRLSCALEMAAAKLQKKDSVRERLLWLFKEKDV